MNLRKHPWAFTVALAAILFLVAILVAGRDPVFGLWGVRCMKPDFPDTHGITSGIEWAREGGDPLVSNPRDPWARTFNYPRVWLGLSHLGIGQEHSVPIGYTLTLLFFLGLALFPPQAPGHTTIALMLVGAFSPAVLLGLERGNSDLLMFFLLACGIAGFSGKRRWGKATGAAAIVAAFVLKIYPLLGAAMILGERKNAFLKYTLGYLLLAASYLFWTRGDLALIHQATPRATGMSYGADVLWMEIAQHGERLGVAAKIASRIGLLLAAGLLVAGFSRRRTIPTATPDCVRSLAAFRTGATIYCGTFVLGNHWDYRLVFLLFTIPFLADCARGSQGKIATVTLTAMLLSLWHVAIYLALKNIPGGSEASVLLDEVCNWVTFLCLSHLLGLSLPIWRRDPEKAPIQGSLPKPYSP